MFVITSYSIHYTKLYEDALIKAGAHEYIENISLSIPDSELSDIEFSDELDKRIRHDIMDYKRQARKPKMKKIYGKAKNVIIRAAAVILIMFIAASGFVIVITSYSIHYTKLYEYNFPSRWSISCTIASANMPSSYNFV